MPANIKTGSMSFPYPLGKVFPGAAFATASVPLTQNVQPVANDGVTPDNMFGGIYIQANPANGAVIYVCSNANPPDTTAYGNVVAVLEKGATYARIKEWSNTRDLSKLFIGGTTATDSVIVSIDQF